MSGLEAALQRALSIRLNLQISLSQLPIIEERMDIHLDRWLEHNPPGTSFAAALGSDLRRMWWGAWGDPRELVPRMADYFKLCNIANSDAALLDKVGEALEPGTVGSWIGVWGGNVVTGWQFVDPQPWAKVEAMFGTHEAKFQLKSLGIERVERFAQSIGDGAYSELELVVPDAAAAFAQLTGAPTPAQFAGATALACRIRGGKIVRAALLAPPQDLEAACAGIGFDPKLPRLIGALGAMSRVEYGRAGERAGVDIHVEPGSAAPAVPAAN